MAGCESSQVSLFNFLPRWVVSECKRWIFPCWNWIVSNISRPGLQKGCENHRTRLRPLWLFYSKPGCRPKAGLAVAVVGTMCALRWCDDVSCFWHCVFKSKTQILPMALSMSQENKMVQSNLVYFFVIFISFYLTYCCVDLLPLDGAKSHNICPCRLNWC